MLKTGLLTCALLAAAASPSLAQVVAANPAAFTQSLRDARVGIITGGAGGTYLQLGADLQRLVEGAAQGSDLRVLPTVGRGSVGNLQDLLYLENVDFSFVQADVLHSIRLKKPEEFEYLKSRVAYVTRLYPEVIHIVARGGARRPEDLRGKTVAIGGAGGGSALTAPIVLRDLLKVEFAASPMGPQEALNNLLSDSPTIDAFVYVSGRGSPLFTFFSPEMEARIREKGVGFVALPEPPQNSGAPYERMTIRDSDYPALIPEGAGVSAWGVPAVLAVYNWDTDQTSRTRQRYRRMEQFIETFFSRRHDLNDGPGGYNENWCNVDIGQSLDGWDGWTRLRAGQEWLTAHPRAKTAVCAARPGDVGFLMAYECAPFHAHLARIDLRLEDLAEPETMFERWLESNPNGCAGTL
ncbi:TAXI family TRAP transporter solute-binding subunit [Neomegalonema sp.]|uniref:TAXI family TRAP transporter solute-binding subunit n=1 Tax=Neomegalonema sp. TaxID=2039713 RepID=UPI002607ACD3|nr:TAXI family TRAP transporter solute-binding subunit [Neomegalonema sp.]MDD2868869.1 TAXI family TRAP transporter solute-binding subunit [Neomegalonema sp.]